MSADNYVLIKKEKGMWTGYLESASSGEPTYTEPVFNVLKIEEAILHAQNSDTEYGYRFGRMRAKRTLRIVNEPLW